MRIEFAICREVIPSAPGFGTGRAIALKAKSDHPRKCEYGWSGTAGYHSTFASIELARKWIDILGLTDVDIRQCDAPKPIDKMTVVWPESAVEIGRARVNAILSAEAEERARRAALPPTPDPSGDPDAWYGDRSD